MIPGEIITKSGDIELNAGAPQITHRSRQHRRPADPGRLALSFLRDQQRPELRPREGARHAARYRRRHRGAVRAGPGARGQLVPLSGTRTVFGFQQKIMGKL